MTGQCNADDCDREAVADWGLCGLCYNKEVGERLFDVEEEQQ